MKKTSLRRLVWVVLVGLLTPTVWGCSSDGGGSAGGAGGKSHVLTIKGSGRSN